MKNAIYNKNLCFFSYPFCFKTNIPVYCIAKWLETVGYGALLEGPEIVPQVSLVFEYVVC